MVNFVKCLEIDCVVDNREGIVDVDNYEGCLVVDFESCVDMWFIVMRDVRVSWFIMIGRDLLVDNIDIREWIKGLDIVFE